MKKNLTLIEAAARLGVSPHTLRHWAIYQGRVAYLRLGRRILFQESDLAAFEEKALVPAVTPGWTVEKGWTVEVPHAE